MTPAHSALLPLDTSLLTPGLRLAVGLSGGADSVALTCALAARASELGLVLHAAHLHHGLRGEEADADLEFARELSRSLGLTFHSAQIDIAAEAAKRRETSETHETTEEAARRLRYQWFRELMAAGRIDAVATAHTLDDQAETVLGKFLRGAWTEGLSGIHPVVSFPEGRILRPLLAASRRQVEAYLAGLNQPWREDSSNRDPAYTRNRLRHQLLPELEQWNPRIREHLANMAELARGEEAWWDAELARLAPQHFLTGRPVRGGGRAGASGTGMASPGLGSTGIALDVVRLGAQPLAMQRRLLRHAAAALGVSLGFEATESLRQLAVAGRSGQRMSLPGGLAAERSPRELRLSLSPDGDASSAGLRPATAAPVELPIPGHAVAFGWRFQAQSASPKAPASIRSWKPGDRVTLRHSSGPRKIKEVLERLKVTGTARAHWPVVEWSGGIVWMQGVQLAPHPELAISAEAES